MTPAIYFEQGQSAEPASSAESRDSVVNDHLLRVSLKRIVPDTPLTPTREAMPAELRYIDRVLFAPRIGDSLKVGKPFEVKIIRQSSETIAVVEELNEFGTGISLGEALEDLRQTLAELYAGLESRGELSPDLEEVRSMLRAHLVPIVAHR